MTPYKRKIIDRESDCESLPLKKPKLHVTVPLQIIRTHDVQRSISPENHAYAGISGSDFSSEIPRLSLRQFQSSVAKNTQNFTISKSREKCNDGSDISEECIMCTNSTLSIASSSSSSYTVEEFSVSSNSDGNELNNALLLEETIEDCSDSNSIIELNDAITNGCKSSLSKTRVDQIRFGNDSRAQKTNILLNDKNGDAARNHSSSSFTELPNCKCLSVSSEISTSSLNNGMILEDVFEESNCSMKKNAQSPCKSMEENVIIQEKAKGNGRKGRRKRSLEMGPTFRKEDFCLAYKEEQEIPFKWMLCNRNFWEKVPVNNIFNKLSKDDAGVRKIFEDILNMNTGVHMEEITAKCLMDLPELVSIIRKIIQHWKRLSLPHLADHFCNQVITSGFRDYTSPDKCVFKLNEVLQLMSCAPPRGRELNLPSTPTSEEELLRQEVYQTPKVKNVENDLMPLGWRQVYDLLVTMLHKVVPVELWGSSHNQKVMFKAIKTILKLGCHDKLFLGQVIKGIKHKHFRWAMKLKKYCHYTYIIGKIWLWVIKRLIMTVSHALFYITETAVRRNQLLFFRKRVWQCVHNREIKKLLERNFCSILSYSDAQALRGTYEKNCKGVITNVRQFPCLRFLPKVHGVRPIIPAGMAGLSKVVGLHCRLLLRELISPFECGSWKVRARSALHTTWCQYIKRVYLTGEPKPFYFVRVDVQDAYGSIRHDTLVTLIQTGVSKLPHVLKFGCYSPIQCSKKSPSRKSYILLDDNGEPTSPLMRGGYPLVQCGQPLTIYPGKLQPSLLKSITLQIAKVTQRQCVRANRGVPQGGTLSGALCELYYSAMCATHLINFNKGDSIILRSVDDFLYITPSSSQAQEFLTRMRKGFPDFNCYINERKTVHNLESGSGKRVAFCGFVVCAESRQILVDSASLSSGLPRYSLRLNKYKSPGQLVALRLQQVSLARLPIAVLDPIYTKPTGLVANVWRAGFMAGARLISLIAALLVPQGSINTSFIAQSVAKVSSSVCTRVKNIWTKAGTSLPFVQEVVTAVFVSAVCAVLRMPYCPTWPKLYGRLKSYVKRLLKQVPQEQYCFLPKLPQHMIAK